jgi:hypothetical protein
VPTALPSVAVSSTRRALTVTLIGASLQVVIDRGHLAVGEETAAVERDGPLAALATHAAVETLGDEHRVELCQVGVRHLLTARCPFALELGAFELHFFD